MKIENVLIANRGEIANRIERTCLADLGIDALGIVVEGDELSYGATLARVTVPSYLDKGAIVAAAVDGGCDAVHPGYGFLAENAEFAQAVIDAGLTWIGPRPDVIAQMGSKIRAREIAEAAGVPLIPGYVDSQDDADLAAAAERIGFPVLVKASAGGGGKGIRIARSADEFAAALTEARAEAERSFGDGDVMVEKYIERPRHIEVQLIGDKHGNVFHLGTRECSIQRRYQKLFEEAPAPNLPDPTRDGLHEAALKLARAVDYDSAGTVEFIVDAETGDFYFLEMNTRLQVEHPVTEEITGLDIVELMIMAAQGDVLDLDGVNFTGHSIEVRITAEDPWADFAPSVGQVRIVERPPGRWESLLLRSEPEGHQVMPTYDSMIAKLVVTGDDRTRALAELRRNLDVLVLSGIVTTAGLHRWLVDQPAVIAGDVTTRFLDEVELPAQPALEAALDRAATAALAGEREPRTGARRRPTVWTRTPRFSLTPHASPTRVLLRDSVGQLHEVVAPAGRPRRERGSGYTPPHHGAPAQVGVNVDGHTHTFDVLDRTEAWAPAAADRAGSGNALTSPFPAAVAEVHVAAGDTVEAGQVLVVIEAMKMLHSLKADGAAAVDEVLVAPGDQVTGGQALITFATEEQDS